MILAALPADLSALSPHSIWTRFGDAIVSSGATLASAAAILLIGLWVAGAAAKSVRRMAERSRRIDATLAAFFAQIVRYAIIAAAALAVLGQFGVQTASIVAMLGAAALAIGLALQGTLSNVAAGVMLVVLRPYRIGDSVEISGESGIVDDVGLFNTTIRALDGTQITLPNSACWGAPIRNFSALPTRRAEITFSISYDSDIDLAIGLVLDAVAADPRFLATPAPLVKVAALSDFSVDLLTHAWANNEEWFLARLDLIKRVKEAFDANGVTIPFPTSLNYELRLQAEKSATPPPSKAQRLPPQSEV